MITWDILLCSIEHRHEKLRKLLDSLAPQIVPGVRVLCYRDNLERTMAEKRQILIDTSKADYISAMDDDDLYPSNHIERCYEAMQSEPDYVGFRHDFYHDGVLQRPVIHSLSAGYWHDEPDCFYRTITHKNPIRRELAIQVPYPTSAANVNGEDDDWSIALWNSGIVKTEVFIDENMMTYWATSSDNAATVREPLTEHPPFLEYDFVTYIPC